MKKRIIYALVLIFIVGFLIIANKKLLKVQTQHTEILKNHSLRKTTQLSIKERLEKGLPPNTYFEEKYLLEINPHTGRTHPENIYKVQQELKEKHGLVLKRLGMAAISVAHWEVSIVTDWLVCKRAFMFLLFYRCFKTRGRVGLQESVYVIVFS